jgi:pSer/pThr/pTyr-binding forkhead associated (FHA) protein
MKLIVEDQEGGRTEFPFNGSELTIGRQEGNALRLEARNVSRRHARLVRLNGAVVVEDLGSFTGVRVNGQPVQGQAPVGEGDQISIGDYSLALETGDAALSPTITPMSLVASTDPAGRNVRTAVINAPPRVIHGSGAIPLPLSERPALLRLEGGAPLEIVASGMVIGRDAAESDLVLDHRSISRRHARVWLDPNSSWHISDLNSINGLRVNGEPYRESPLRSGDEVVLGHVRLRFLGPGEERPPVRIGLLSALPRWTVIAGLVALVAIVEILRWSGSLSRVAPYFGVQPPAPSAPVAPRPPAPTAVIAPAVSPAPPEQPASPSPRAELAAAPVQKPMATSPARHPEAPARARPSPSPRMAAPADVADAPTTPDPARAAQAYEDAISLINSSDFQDALAKLHHALQWNPQLAEAHKAMGICFANLHQPDKGAYHYEQYLKLRPQASDAADVRRLLSDYYKTLPDKGPSPAPPGSGPP